MKALMITLVSFVVYLIANPPAALADSTVHCANVPLDYFPKGTNVQMVLPVELTLEIKGDLSNPSNTQIQIGDLSSIRTKAFDESVSYILQIDSQTKANLNLPLKAALATAKNSGNGFPITVDSEEAPVGTDFSYPSGSEDTSRIGVAVYNCR